MKVLGQLLTPTDYLLVRAETLDKVVVDWLLPALLAFVTTYVWWRWPKILPFTGNAGLMAGVGGFMQVLVGFYVAALAAVATFPGSSLEDSVNRMTLRSGPVKRRLFLSYLFGYLALLSLVLFLGILFKGIPIAIVQALDLPFASMLKVALHFIYQFAFWQMITITLLGLHYLTNRIHRANSAPK